MKKISTLAFMAFFFCLSAMAQVELGDIQFSLGEGKKINPNTGVIKVTFPNATGVDFSTATFELASFSFNDEEFDGLEGTFAEGAIIELKEYELEPSTEYTLTISSVKVGGGECAAEGGYVLHFVTRGGERKMSWDFTINEEIKAAIVADDKNDPSTEGTYWKCIKADERHYVHQSLKDSEIMLDANTVYPVAEDLTFNAGSDNMFVGDLTGGFKGMLVFNNNRLRMTIPDCKVGDVITFNGINATNGNASKQTCIQALYGGAIAPEGLESTTGLQDSLWVAADGNYKFEVTTEGDVSFNFSNFRMRTITIEEGIEKKPCSYNIVAAYIAEDGTKTELKELQATTEGISGTTVKVMYPYWLADANGNVYTHAATGKEFTYSFDLKGDTTFILNYNKTSMEGMVYLSEGEDIEGAKLCMYEEDGVNRALIRSSMGKAAYFEEDVKLVTLIPGTYQIKAIIFDTAKSASHDVTLTKGEGEENEVHLISEDTNFSEQTSDLLEIVENTDIILKAGGSDSKGLDVIVIYASTDAPDDPDDPTAIENAKTATEKVATRKVVKGGKIVIETKNGTFNVAGVQQK